MAEFTRGSSSSSPRGAFLLGSARSFLGIRKKAMSADYKVAIIGAGRPRGTEGATGFGMSHHHMDGYAKTGRCKLVAVVDINRENA